MNSLIIANWKCNPSSLKKAKQLYDQIEKYSADFKKSKVVICPPSIFLPELLAKSKIAFGAQNCFCEEGAYTGEVSISMLESIGCRYVILGHSERRNIFGETNEQINKKIVKVLESKIIPILCIGESKKEREEERTFEVLEDQISECLKGISKEKVKKVVLAYEPIWAIGTGKFAGVDKIQEVRSFINQFISIKFGKDVSLRTIYGGSVNSKNSDMYIREGGMDGVLVGGASLNVKDFLGIIKSANAE